MKYIWEESDITPGRKVRTLAWEEYTIGWLQNRASNDLFVLSRANGDGMVFAERTKKEMVLLLNDFCLPCEPKY